MDSANLNDDIKHWLRRDKFRIFTSNEFMREPTQVRNAVGVYAILLRNIDEKLSRARLPDTGSVTRWCLRDHQHVYTGLSVAMRSRVLLHLCGTVRDSALRENLLALQFSDEILWQGRDVNLNAWEERLTDWLANNAFVAFRLCDEPHTIEREMIERLPSPFNTEGNKGGALVSTLTERRGQFRLHLKMTGQVGHRAATSPSERLVGAAANHLAGWQSKQST